MTKTIFFSWQSETPSKVGRGFLKDVLDEVCKNLTTDIDINEAHRDLTVDSDTQGVAGQPPIVDTIFKKIDSAGVFIADMTFTGVRIDKRPTPNPNVLIEYGWALKSLTHERVLCVMNDVYGEPSHDSLPFDLSHMRWPIRYSLPDDASTETRKIEKQKLVTVLTTAIRASIKTIPVTNIIEESKPFPLAHALADRARFRAPNEALGLEYDSFHAKPKDIFLSTGPAMWIRLMPSADQNKTWAPHEIKSYFIEGGQMRLSPISDGAGGYGSIRSSDGAGMYKGKPQTKDTDSIETDSVVFTFNTGEIWSIDTLILEYSGNNLPFIEDVFTKCTENYSDFLKTLGIKPPFIWKAGIIGVKNRHLQYPLKPGFGRVGDGPVCATDVIFAEGEYNGDGKVKEALMPLFKKIFEQCGLPRPDYLDN